MYNLMKFELYKLKYNTAFKISISIILFLIFLVLKLFYSHLDIIVIFSFIYDRKTFGFFINKFHDISSPTALEFFISSFGFSVILIILSLFLVGSYIVNEYSCGTVKNTLSYGHSRLKVYLSKIITIYLSIFILLILLLFVPLITALILGWVKSISAYTAARLFKYTLIIYLIFAAIASIYACLAAIIKSKSIIIALGMTILFINAGGFLINFKFDKYTPVIMLMKLGSLNSPTSDICSTISICSIIILISLVLGITVFKNQDIR
ncbi:MAG TPA: ABC transporter permease [Clostridium sp.]|jgi:ABC-2 type transport system permease protein|uniref:ABC transporter permease n=1 Tax=uncultured Clostridium sp. TaxID=59620 RepID=UPI000E9A77AA|nr:ABC transporter permease [uncultured Clostridium sp.]HBC96490.1 ABC transporter permease [Clostridium sp.]